MVDPRDVPRVLTDAARLVRDGEIVVFGSSALAFWLEDAPASRDVDVWTDPPGAGDAVEALMGELSWCHDRHHVWVEVWGPETFAAPSDWRSRARVLRQDDLPGVRLVVPHPHDVLLSRLERMEPRDRDHVARILAAYPMDAARLDGLVAGSRTGTAASRTRAGWRASRPGSRRSAR
jgi:hypothetical protein